jgi:hypothetical protein
MFCQFWFFHLASNKARRPMSQPEFLTHRVPDFKTQSTKKLQSVVGHYLNQRHANEIVSHNNGQLSANHVGFFNSDVQKIARLIKINNEQALYCRIKK